MRPDTLDPCVSTPQGSDEKKTRAEVLALREGFARGLQEATGWTPFYCAARAKEAYPMPKKTVPREANYNGTTYRFVNGGFQFKMGDNWLDSNWLADEKARNDIAAVLALRDNPTCEVEDE